MITHRATRCVTARHPCLPGHFPERPIVPAVVLLEHVERALGEALAAPVRLTAVPSVKFLSPLGPDVPFDIDLEIDGGTARFRCSAAGRELAQGRLEFARD